MTREQTLRELSHRLQAQGFASEDLDDLVHDLASIDPSSVNNDGMEAQLGFLAYHVGVPLLERFLHEHLDGFQP